MNTVCWLFIEVMNAVIFGNKWDQLAANLGNLISVGAWVLIPKLKINLHVKVCSSESILVTFMSRKMHSLCCCQGLPKVKRSIRLYRRGNGEVFIFNWESKKEK